MRKSVNKYLQKINNLSDNYLLISLFAILVTLALIPFNNITLTTNDDFKTFMNTIGSPLNNAITQGRFQFLYQLLLAKIPFLFNNLFVFQLIRDLSHVILLIVISYSIYIMTKSTKISLLIFLLFFAWIQNSNTHNLITSYILVFHIPLISIFLSFIIFEKFSLHPSLKNGVIIFLLFFYGISGYESLIFFLALAPFFDRSSIKRFKKRIQIYLPFFASIVLYIITTIIWKEIFPSHYTGNTLNISYTDIPLALKVCFRFTIAALPAFFYFLQKLYAYNSFELLRNAGYVTFIQSLVTFILSVFIMARTETESDLKTGNRKLIALSVVAVFIAFAVNVLYGLTSKYREWVSGGVPAFVGTFFSALCFAIFFATLITIVLNILQKRLSSLARFISISIIALGISLVSILIGISNQNVSNQETDMTSKLELVNQFLSSDTYKTLNEKDIIVSESLFEGNPGFLTSDWTDYFQFKTGKKINVVKSLNDRKEVIFKRQIELNIIKVDSDPFDNVLVASEVMPNSNNLEFSNILYLYSNKSGVLDILGTYDHPKDYKSSFKMISDNLQSYTYNQETFSALVDPTLQKNGYYARVSTGEPFNIKSIQVTRNVTPINLSSYSIVWGKGFYDLEQNPEHRWSQKDSIMTIVNSNLSPILVQLSGNYTTGHTEFSSIKINSKLFADVINVNNQGKHWEKTIELPPGNTQIEFSTDAERVDAPKDPRQLFFSMRDFSISQVSQVDDK